MSRTFGMVLAAGRGTRLRPLTDRVPKPAVPVRGVPLAARALRRLAEAGVERVGLNTHHLADEVERRLRPHVPPGMEVSFHPEPRLLGTGGGIGRVMRSLGVGPTDRLLVLNGDILAAPPLRRLLERHAARRAKATFVLRPHPGDPAIGSLDVDTEGRVRRLLDAPGELGTLTRRMYTGALLLSGEALVDLPEEGGILRATVRRWLDAGREDLWSVLDEGPFADLGTPTAYRNACLEGVAGTWGDRSRVGAGAVLHRVVLEAGAVVEAGARLERVVVWPGAVASGRLRDAIVTPDGVIGGGTGPGELVDRGP